MTHWGMAGLPGARTLGGLLARARAFVLVGPRAATTGPFEWAKSLALATALSQMAYFLVCVALAAIELGFGEADQLKVVGLAALGALMFAGMQWLVTIFAMLVACLAGWLLARLPMWLGAAIGALWIGAVAIVIEPVGAVMYFELSDTLEMWTGGYWLLAGLVGGLYGAWLPRAVGAYLRERAERRAAVRSDRA